MKRILFILFAYLPLWVAAQMVQPTKWTAEETGDSVRLKATIEEGWHMTIIEFGDREFDEEYKDSFVLTVAKADLTPIRFNSCNDVMCTAPEVWEWSNVQSDNVQSTKEMPSTAGDHSLWVIFLLGLLGGLLAIFTPCVWPIIPMTVSFFLKKGGGMRDAVLYGLSIIILYVGLGLLVTVIFGASALNDLSTNAVVNIFFFLILVLFALSFFGLFEITLPDSWSTAMDSKARSTGGFLSILLMAFTLVIVSFSCTGPIIGTLLVEAAGKSLLAPAIGMLGFSIALALPFSLFAMFPQWLKQAPKSGDWMTSFKVVLAFLELALSLKFLSVA
ncbi:MAG: thiol:disulfide interchange protein, partial [Paludibacteraceae bacterium]|nr:thiol:disulfide interchange protein [Paludibacteraceae bacterium]